MVPLPRPSPLPNRVAPDGSLAAVSARGTLMGNRGGRLHLADGRLGASRWRGPAWITCCLAFRGRHRQVWREGYTELFFLDEATALAAGHRPCWECRREAALAFADAWARAAGLDAPPRAPEIDAVLHRQRLAPPERAAPKHLPPGSIFAHAGEAWLRTAEGARRWSFAGYGPPSPLTDAATVAVLTPAATRAAIAAGYAPGLHPSVRS